MRIKKKNQLIWNAIERVIYKLQTLILLFIKFIVFFNFILYDIVLFEINFNIHERNLQRFNINLIKYSIYIYILFFKKRTKKKKKYKLRCVGALSGFVGSDYARDKG